LTESVGDLERCIFSREVLSGFGVSAESVEGFDGEDLLREDVTELAGSLMGDVLERGQRHSFGAFEVEAGDGLVSDAAGVDELEVAEVGGDVEGEAVGGDSAGDVDADGADFAFARGTGLVVVQAAPYTGESGDAAGADAVDSAKSDEGFFHHADKVDGTEATAAGVLETAEIEDGIADELAGTVVGDVAAAIDFVEGDAAAQELFAGREDVGTAGVAAKGEDGWVFEEQEGVVDVICETHGRDLCLDAEGFVVGYAAEVEVLDHGTFIVWMRALSALRCGLEDRREV
jgi:hypothetical protein